MNRNQGDVATIVHQTIGPLMKRYGIPGMAIGILVDGQPSVIDIGVASKTTQRPVSSNTLFEIGSITKTFTATLAADAHMTGKLSLSDRASMHLHRLAGSSFDRVSLLDLGTYTAGGLPLQVPSDITNDGQLLSYFRHWKASYTPGTDRLYSNVSIGLLGMIAAHSMHGTFATLMSERVLRPLGMHDTFLRIPSSQAENYAQGYTESDAPIRLAPGVLALETYGIRTTAADMLRFLAANMATLDTNHELASAIADTHTGYYRIGPMTQDLIWEQYPYPTRIDPLLTGNSERIAFEANRAIALVPPLSPRDNVLINKTGSTNGFAAYVAFVPARKLGIVLLANKSYPIAARVSAAYRILSVLDDGRPRRSLHRDICRSACGIRPSRAAASVVQRRLRWVTLSDRNEPGGLYRRADATTRRFHIVTGRHVVEHAGR